MGNLKRVKLMDSGMARFPANGLEDAVRRVRAVLTLYGSVSSPEGQPDRIILDCSGRIHHEFVIVKLGPTSTPGEWAAEFQEGNCATWLGYIFLQFGALGSCHRRMRAIVSALDSPITEA